jgi:hypothetical protein
MSFLSNIFPVRSGNPANGGPFSAAAPAHSPVPAPAPAPTPAPTPASSPLDDLAKIWDTPLNADGKPVVPAANPLTQPLFNFDPAKITESANKMDFTVGIQPELITKALAGDPAAFAEAINTAMRSAVAGMTLSQGNLINQAFLANNARVESALPAQINKVRLLETSASDNPVFSHPAAQPLVNSLKQMAFAKDPTASPDAINTQIQNFLSGLATAITESSPANQQAAAAKKASSGTDWDSWDPV